MPQGPGGTRKRSRQGVPAVSGSGGGGTGQPTAIVSDDVGPSDALVGTFLIKQESVGASDASIKFTPGPTDNVGASDVISNTSASITKSDNTGPSDASPWEVVETAKNASGTPDADSWGDAWVDRTLANQGTHQALVAGTDPQFAAVTALTEQDAYVEIDYTRFASFLHGTGFVVGSIASPTAIPNIDLWLRADLGVTTVSGKVSAWNDQSGTGDPNKNCVQATAGLRPTFNASDASFNNQPSMTFVAASSQILESATWASPPVAGTFFIVAKTTTTAASGLCSWNIVSGNAGLQNSSGTTMTYGEATSVAITVAATTSPHIYAVDSPNSLGTTNMYQDGASPIAAQGLGTSGVVAYNGVTVGSSTSVFLDGTVCEVIRYKRILTQTERAQVMNYLGARYGIAIARTQSSISFTVDWPNAVTNPNATITVKMQTNAARPFVESTITASNFNGNARFNSVAPFTDRTFTFPQDGTTGRIHTIVLSDAEVDAILGAKWLVAQFTVPDTTLGTPFLIHGRRRNNTTVERYDFFIQR